MKRWGTLALVVVALSQLGLIAKKPEGNVFYVYTDYPSRLNHYIPSGWMGDFGDIKMNQGWKEKVGKGQTCIQFKYSAERKQQAGWAGVYWQSPANNWGEKEGGFDLSGFKTLKFMARGEKGGEYLDKVMVGGIVGQGAPGDSDSNDTGAIELTKDWKEYDLDISKLDLSGIIGGFGFAMNSEMNPNGMTFYFDEVRFER